MTEIQRQTAENLEAVRTLMEETNLMERIPLPQFMCDYAISAASRLNKSHGDGTISGADYIAYLVLLDMCNSEDGEGLADYIEKNLPVITEA